MRVHLMTTFDIVNESQPQIRWLVKFLIPKLSFNFQPVAYYLMRTQYACTFKNKYSTVKLETLEIKFNFSSTFSNSDFY